MGEAGLGECEAAPLRAVPRAAGKGPMLVGTGQRSAGCGSGHLAARGRSPTANLGSGSAKQLPLGLCPEQRARVPCLWGPARGLPGADQGIRRLWSRAPLAKAAELGLGSAKQHPPWVVPRAAGEGPMLAETGPWPIRIMLPNRMRVRAPCSKSAASRRQSGALGVRSSSPPGCARSSRQGSHS